ncbi:unnamed protein product [Caenorhabditis sp. 36 PRJEB53466]|nr:unnamed protein product [Caenorhabditis sp. 36 PRJEB53466]
MVLKLARSIMDTLTEKELKEAASVHILFYDDTMCYTRKPLKPMERKQFRSRLKKEHKEILEKLLKVPMPDVTLSEYSRQIEKQYDIPFDKVRSFFQYAKKHGKIISSPE